MQEYRRLVEAFESTTLLATEWTHQAHLAIAIWYVFHHGSGMALDKLRKNIRQFNEAKGTPNTDQRGYHETITRFWVWNTHQFLRKQTQKNLALILHDFIASPFGKKDYPLTYYRTSRLFSVDARITYLPPDRKPLD